MRQYKYILDDEHNPVPVDDVLAWATWFETQRVRGWRGLIAVERSIVHGVIIETYFTCMDRTWFHPVGPPLLFETMVYHPQNDPLDPGHVYQEYATYADAKRGHAAAVALEEQFEQSRT